MGPKVISPEKAVFQIDCVARASLVQLNVFDSIIRGNSVSCSVAWLVRGKVLRSENPCELIHMAMKSWLTLKETTVNIALLAA